MARNAKGTVRGRDRRFKTAPQPLGFALAATPSTVTFGVRPARAGLRVAIQKLNRRGRWITVSGTVTRKGTANFSVFAKRVRVLRGGRYRAFVEFTDGSLVSAPGTAIRITSFRRR